MRDGQFRDMCGGFHIVETEAADVVGSQFWKCRPRPCFVQIFEQSQANERDRRKIESRVKRNFGARLSRHLKAKLVCESGINLLFFPHLVYRKKRVFERWNVPDVLDDKRGEFAIPTFGQNRHVADGRA